MNPLLYQPSLQSFGCIRGPSSTAAKNGQDSVFKLDGAHLLDAVGSKLSSRNVIELNAGGEKVSLDLSKIQCLQEEQLSVFENIGFEALCDTLDCLYVKIQSLQTAIEAQQKTLKDCAALTNHLNTVNEAAQKAMHAFQEGLKYLVQVEAQLQSFRDASRSMDESLIQGVLQRTSGHSLVSSLEKCQELKKHYQHIETWDQSMEPLKQDTEALTTIQQTYEQDLLQLNSLKECAYKLLATLKDELNLKSAKNLNGFNALMVKFPEAHFRNLTSLAVGKELPKVFRIEAATNNIIFPTIQTLTFNYTFGLKDLKLPILSASTVRDLTLSSPCLRSLEGLEAFNQLYSLKLKTEESLTAFVLSRKLENLRELSLSGHFTHINGVEQCPNLECVSIRGCGSLRNHDLVALKQLSQLHTLHIRSLPFIPDLEGINEVRVLTMEAISGDIFNERTIKDLKLESLEHLHTLSLIDLHPIKSFKNIGDLSSLEVLHLIKIYRLEDLQGLERLFNIRTLHLETLQALKSCQLQVLGSLKQLKTITIKNCPNLLHKEALLPLIEKDITLHLKLTKKDTQQLQVFMHSFPEGLRQRLVLGE